MPGPVFLDGDRIELRAIEEDDLELLQQMVNNPNIRPMISVDVPTTRHQEQQWYEKQVSDDDDGIHLMIAVDGEAVGTIWLLHRSVSHPETEIIVFLAEEYWGNGYGTEASRLITDYAFTELRKHRVETSVYEINERSKRIWEKLGFKHEAVLSECAFVDGEYVDVHIYRVLEDEWVKHPSEHE